MQAKIVNVLMIIFSFILLISWSYITILNLFFFKNGTFYAVASFLLLALIIFIFRKRIANKMPDFIEKKHRLLFIFFTILMVVILFLSWAQLQVDFSWDYKEVFVLAYQKATGQKLERIHYLARYPNNNMIFLWITALCKVILKFNPQASIETCNSVAVASDCILIFVSLCSLYYTSARLYGKKIALISYMISTCCLPLLNYCVICYTDTVGLFFLCMFFSLYFMYKSETDRLKYLYLFLTMVIAGASYCMKATLVIPIIAVFLYECLYMFKNKKKMLITFLWIALCGTTFVVTKNTLTTEMKQRVRITKKYKDKYEFPMEHWIMMTLKGNGGYNADDANYTMSFKKLEQRKKADREMIVQRLNEMKLSGLLKHILFTKWQFTWANATFFCDYTLGLYPKENTIIGDIVTIQGSKHIIYVYLTHMWWLFVLLSVLLSIGKSFKKKELTQANLFHITIFGVILFLSIWECTSRYLYVFIPVLSLCAAFGLQNSNEMKETN